MEEDRKLKLFAVDSYVSLLQGEPGKLPQRFLQVISWVSAAPQKAVCVSIFVMLMITRSRRGKNEGLDSTLEHFKISVHKKTPKH